MISEQPAITLTASSFPFVSGNKIIILIIFPLVKLINTWWKVLGLTHMQQLLKYLAQISNEYMLLIKSTLTYWEHLVENLSSYTAEKELQSLSMDTF